MKNNKILTSLAATGIVAALVATMVVPAFAATINVDVSASTSAKILTRQSTNMTTGETRANTAIDARITALNNLSARINDMKNVSASEKSSMTAEIQTELTDMTNLKAKIDADTDAAVLKTDMQSITNSYRIYALILPQDYIAATADRVATIGGLMTTLSSKLQTRISAAATAGQNTGAMVSLMTAMNAKVLDATTQASAASSEVVSLNPDQGNATVAASNKAALTDARAKLKISVADLKTARDDAQTIVNDLKALHVSTSAAASTTTH